VRSSSNSRLRSGVSSVIDRNSVRAKSTWTDEIFSVSLGHIWVNLWPKKIFSKFILATTKRQTPAGMECWALE